MYATLTLPAGQDLDAPRRSPTVRVRSADELRNALRQARAQALTLDASGLDRVLHADAARGLLEVQAATSWSELAGYLSGRGIALDSFAGLARLPATVGEAVSQASAGPDGLPVSAHVVAATLVTPDGELRRADRHANPQLLELALGGQGVLGVLYSLTLSIESLQRSAAQCRRRGRALHAGGRFGGRRRLRHRMPAAAGGTGRVPADVRSLVDERRLALLGISVRRTLAERSCHLNWATREWAGVEIRFGTKTTLGASVVAAEVRRALLAAALARGGSFPVADLRDATRAQLETCYPMLKGFLAEKRRADPAERLQNAWYRQVSAKLRAESCDVRWSRG